MRLTTVQDVFTRQGPFVTVHADVGRTGEDARQQLDARWTTIRHALEHEGVDAGLVDEIGTRLHELPPTSGPAHRTLVAADGEIVFDETQAGTTRWPEVAEVAPLPDLAGWVGQADREVPFVLVVADQVGADIEFHEGLGVPEVEEQQVQGEEFGVTKVPQGDWKQKQYQRSADNQRRENAAEVVEAVRSGIRRQHPRVVVLAGDERARHEIEEGLAGLDVPVVHTTAGGRGAGASEEALWDDVRRIVADLEAHQEEDVTDDLLARTGRGHGAARGLDDVLEALVKGQVDRLVLDLDEVRGMTVDPAEHPGLALPASVEGPQPADRVLVAAAAATDARLSVLSKDQSKGAGVAAILRWDEGLDDH